MHALKEPAMTKLNSWKHRDARDLRPDVVGDNVEATHAGIGKIDEAATC
jgi:hypothetical protein